MLITNPPETKYVFVASRHYGTCLFHISLISRVDITAALTLAG